MIPNSTPTYRFIAPRPSAVHARLRQGGAQLLDRHEQPLRDGDVDVDEAVAVEHHEAGKVHERLLAHLGHERRQLGGDAVALRGDAAASSRRPSAAPEPPALVRGGPHRVPVDAGGLPPWRGRSSARADITAPAPTAPAATARRTVGVGSRGIKR